MSKEENVVKDVSKKITFKKLLKLLRTIKDPFTVMEDGDVFLTRKAVDEIALKLIDSKETKDTTAVVTMFDHKDVAKCRNILNAERYIRDHAKLNEKPAYIAERLRHGYIGKEVFDNEGTKWIQATRAAPYGTLVAVPFTNREGEPSIAIGASVVSEEEAIEDISPALGLYLALKNAEQLRDEVYSNDNVEHVTIIKRTIKNISAAQVEHFAKRAFCFFYPEKYSHSSGTEPIEFKNYDKIRENRKKILGK